MITQELIENIFVICSYAAANLSVTPEWFHSNENTGFCNLVFICKGQGVFTCNDKTYIVNPGDIIYFPEGVKRTMRSNGGILTFHSVNFKYSFVFNNNSNWSTEQHELGLDFVKSISDKSLLTGIDQIFTQLWKYYISKQYNSAFHMRYYVTELISLLIASAEGHISFSEQNIADKSIKYMSEHLSEKITLADLADISGKSIPYYSGIFKKVTGSPPIDYLISMRISQAKQLLKNGLSVTEASQLCGFESPYYFSKAFKKREYISPREYVNMCRQYNN